MSTKPSSSMLPGVVHISRQAPRSNTPCQTSMVEQLLSSSHPRHLLILVTCVQEQHATSPSVQNCLYCKQPCGTDMFSVEPMWCCSWCPAVCHMHCYKELHPSDALASRHHSMDHKQQPASSPNADRPAATVQPAGKRHRSKSLDSRNPLGRVAQDSKREGFGSQDDLARHR